MDQEEPTEAALHADLAILKHALETTTWNVKRAAQLLGIGRATLYRKIDRYKLREFQPERNAG